LTFNLQISVRLTLKKLRYPDILGKSGKKTLFEPSYCWKFPTKVGEAFVLYMRNGANS